MEHRYLGTSGLAVSEVTYGNWLTHGETVEREAAVACVRAALEAGITTFDTADVYAFGAAEETLGAALRGVRRESVEIATKVCLPVGDGRNDRGLSRKHILESCHASLRRLGTDHIDLYQAHRFDDATPVEETLVAFDDLVRQGKVLYLGVSEWTAGQLEEAVRLAGELGLGSRIVSNQPQYNMLWRVIEPEVVPLCEREGIGQLVFQPLAQLAIAWTLHRPGVSSAIIGASRPEQVAENAAASGVRLEPALLDRVDEVLGDLIDRDPAKTARMMDVNPGWARAAG
jgi:aryl-alcohol dehydrogenase-like predicted oxidoreductase